MHGFGLGYLIRTRDCWRQGSVAHDHGGAEDGDGEEPDLGGIGGLELLLEPLRPPQPRAGRLHPVVGYRCVLALLVWDHPDLGVPRDQRVERERSTCSFIYTSFIYMLRSVQHHHHCK